MKKYKIGNKNKYNQLDENKLKGDVLGDIGVD